MNIYIVGPVRGIEGDVHQTIAHYVQAQEYDGHTVHWSLRDTEQNDPTGYRICTDNLRAIQNCDRVDVFWTGTSQGPLFDLGIAWALGKPLKLVEEFVEPPKGKCFQRVLREWADEPPEVSPLLKGLGCLQECETKEDMHERAQCKLVCLAGQLGITLRELRSVKSELEELREKPRTR